MDSASADDAIRPGTSTIVFRAGWWWLLIASNLIFGAAQFLSYDDAVGRVFAGAQVTIGVFAAATFLLATVTVSAEHVVAKGVARTRTFRCDEVLREMSPYQMLDQVRLGGRRLRLPVPVQPRVLHEGIRWCRGELSEWTAPQKSIMWRSATLRDLGQSTTHAK